MNLNSAIKRIVDAEVKVNAQNMASILRESCELSINHENEMNENYNQFRVQGAGRSHM